MIHMTRIIFTLLLFAILFPFQNNRSANDPAHYRIEINALVEVVVERRGMVMQRDTHLPNDVRIEAGIDEVTM
mgnify:CR=1 FL=1